MNKFIVIEGSEGVGKSSQIKSITSFLEENKPLGTAGVLFKLKNKNRNYIISNCDVIFDIDYNYLIKFHEKKNFDIHRWFRWTCFACN